MSASSNFGKLYTALVIQKLVEAGAVKTFLDIGAGEGTYSKLLRASLPGTTWHAVEVWQPYVGQHGLWDLYDHVHVADARKFDLSKVNGGADMVLCGDVLEHMEKQDALDLTARFLAEIPFQLISIPVVHYPQGEVHGNPYEAHVKDDWSHNEVVESFPAARAAFVHDHIGVYLLTKRQDYIAPLRQVHEMVAKLVEQQLPDDNIFWK